MRVVRGAFCFALLLLPCAVPAARPAFVAADNTALVEWSGRVVRGTAAGSIAFDWLGVSARFALVNATWCTVLATTNGTTGTRLRVYTSDQDFMMYPLATVWVSGRGPTASTETLLYAGDAPAPSGNGSSRALTIENMLGGGTSAGVTTVHGFRSDGVFVAPPDRPPRAIEFVGDSITAATNLVRPAGAPACRGNAVQENWSLSYAARLCHRFGARCSTVAVGGRCMMRECGGLQMPDYYKSALLASAPAATYDFGRSSGWVPDAVVIALGTNDERAIHGHPGRNESFANQTVAFLRSVADRYASAHAHARARAPIQFFVVGGPIRNFTGAWSTRALPVAVARANAQGLSATFVDLTGACALARLHEPDNVDLCDGCSEHPGVEGHYEMYERAAPVMAAKLGLVAEEEVFVRETLEAGDLVDVEAAYQGSPSLGFWVVLAAVAARGGVEGSEGGSTPPQQPQQPQQVVGCVGLRAGAREGVADIGRFTVARTHRGRGAGRMLLAALETQARRAGFGSLTATTVSLNAPALAAFAACGFTEVYRGRQDGKPAPEWVPFVRFEKALRASQVLDYDAHHAD
eukprot:g1082.t1